MFSLEPARQRDIHRERENLSREVFPPADEAGGTETRNEGALWQPGAGTVADSGMDIDVVESQESDLKGLVNVMTRDAVAEVN